jgi:outer membrane lipoprotein-sorting protein
MLLSVLSPQTVMEKQAAVLKAAQGLTVTYSVRLDGAKTDYTINYSKPNLISVDSANRLIVSDGKTLTEYNKTDKTYTEEEITPEMLAKRAQSDEMIGWAAFFTEDLMKKMSNFQGGTPRNLKGNATTEVTATIAGATPRSITFYVDDKLSVARGFALKTEKGDLVAMADQIAVSDKPLAAEKFAFKAPEGAKKSEKPKVEEGATFASVRSIFTQNCSGCHSGGAPKGGYSTTSYQGIMAGGKVVPGDPDNSPLVQYLTGARSPRMPAGRGPLSEATIGQIKTWIKAGAKE